MAWMTPVYDRADGARMTAGDCNRITGNLAWLGGTGLPADVTEEDILTPAWMTGVLAALKRVCEATQVEYDGIDRSWTYQNINAIEYLIFSCYQMQNALALQQPLTIYSGELYSGQGSYYTGGF